MRNRIKIYLKDVTDFGSINSVAIHMKPEDEQDIFLAVDQAAKDLFPAVYLYLNDSSQLTKHFQDFIAEEFNVIQKANDHLLIEV